MSGAGVFINAKPLALLAGKLSFLSYLVGLIVIFPIILVLTGLAQQKPVAGGLYCYAKDELGVGLGFLGVWAYFLSKVVSIAVLAQAFTVPFKLLVPNLSVFAEIALDASMLLIIVGLNIFGLRLYGPVQLFFTFIKSIPYLSIIVVSAIMFAKGRFDNLLQFAQGTDLLASFSSAIFAISGFEIVSTMAHTVQNPEKTIRRAALSAFACVGFLYIAFQVGSQLLCGSELAIASSPFTFIATKLSSYFGVGGQIVGVFMRLTTITISFSLLTNNCWNLYAIARDKLLPFSTVLTKVNRNEVPWVCLLIEVALATFIMSITQNQVALQAMSVFATGISFTFCAVAGAFYWRKNNNNLKEVCIAGFAIISCLIMLSISAKSILKEGLSLPFLAIFFSGILLALLKKLAGIVRPKKINND